MSSDNVTGSSSESRQSKDRTVSNNRRCTTEYRELISNYIDGDLDAAERQRLLAHLATCAECRQILEDYRLVGSRVRSLPRAVPPPELRDAIFAHTIDTKSRKVYLLTSRLGYSVAALAAVLLIFVVAIYLLINGYQRSIDPEVVASQPGNGMLWPLSRPVEITFNKEMDKESVEAALSIVPATEKDRLTLTWNGNTVVLGLNQTLHSGSSYSILITTNAQDKWGKNLGSDFRLQFETSDSFALQTPVPLPTPTATSEPTVAPTTTPTLAPQSTATPGGDILVPLPPTASATAPVVPSPATVNSTATAPLSIPTAEPTPAINAAPTATPEEIEPTATDVPEPSPTATERPTATPAPTGTPRPIPSPTSTSEPPTATATEPPASATPDTVPVIGAFGNVYWTNEIVQSRLGEALASASSTTGVELDFQHGAMFSRSDTSQTYVLESATGIWSVLPSSSESASSAVGPDPDTWIPGGSLGALWSDESWIQASLGYAFAPSGTVFESRVQRFEHGSMLMSASGQIYVIYDSGGTWELYPDPGS
jgi:Bacterial Ig-like domain/Putative zinc-finger